MFFGAGGSFAIYPAVALLIKHLDWRSTFVVEGAVIVGVMLPVIIFLVRYHPREKGLFADGVSESTANTPAGDNEALRITDEAWAAEDWTLAKAAKTSRFWLLCLSTFALWGIMEHIVVAHHVACATDLGYSKVYASSVLSLLGVMFALGSLIGFVSDRIGREATMTIGTVIGIAGILLLTLMRDASQPWMLYGYAIGMGLGLGITAPTIAAAATDIFQGRAVGGAAIWLAAPRKVRLVPGRVRAR
jgi:MFS family permease